MPETGSGGSSDAPDDRPGGGGVAPGIGPSGGPEGPRTRTPGGIELPGGGEAPQAAGAPGAHDAIPDRGPASYVAEFLGTLALVFFITAAFSLYVRETPGFIDYSVIGLVHVFALFFLVQVFVVASGAHFNPAVTAALTALRQISLADGAIYVVTQLAGGVAGALLTKALLSDEGELINYGATTVQEPLDGDILPGMVVEALGTFFLVLVVAGVAVNPRAAREWAGLTIGATLGLLVMVFAPLTRAGFNPARSFGPALVSDEFGGLAEFVLVYVLAPLVGALLAALLYRELYMDEGGEGRRGGGLRLRALRVRG